MEMFSGEKMDHVDGYKDATEWIEVVLKTWSEQYFDYKGEYFEIKDCWQNPKPIQDPRPLLISAGTSKAGRNFAAKYTDFNFGAIESMEHCEEWTKYMKKLAWDEYKREINTFTTCYVICRPTEKEAQEAFNYYIKEMGDWEAASIISTGYSLGSGSHSPEHF